MKNITRLAALLAALAMTLACAGALAEQPFFAPVTQAPAEGFGDFWMVSPTETPAAFVQYVHANVPTNVLAGPGAANAMLGTLQMADELEYLGEAAVDGLGVIWYKVAYAFLGEGWVSSADTVIVLKAADAVVPTTGNFAVALTGEAFVRIAPGDGFTALATIPLGAAATYLNQYTADANGVIWYYVSFNGTAGWVSSAAATLRDVVEPVATPVPTPTPTPAPTAPAGSTVKASGGSTNIRSGPGLGYGILTAMNKDAVATFLKNVSVDDRGVMWYNVKHNGVTGWVSSKYTTVGDWALSNGTSTTSASGSYVEATGGDSHLRTGPGLSYDDVGTLKKGATASYLGEQSTDDRGVVWYKISYNGKTVWVSSKYTKLRQGSSGSGSSGSGSSGTKVEATGGNSNLRSGPGLSYDDVGTMHKGDSATYLGEKSTDDRGVVWYKVKFNGKTGWVSSKYTTLK